MLASRSWFVRVTLTEKQVVVHGWTRNQRIGRASLVGATIAPYPGQFPVSLAWAMVEQSLTSLRLIVPSGEHVEVPDAFGYSVQMSRLVGEIDAALDATQP